MSGRRIVVSSNDPIYDEDTHKKFVILFTELPKENTLFETELEEHLYLEELSDPLPELVQLRVGDAMRDFVLL